jgi:hypothetical protein
MRFQYILIIFVLLSSFTTYRINTEVPEDLKNATIIIINRNFKDWSKTVENFPKGFDDYAQKHMYSEYQTAINELEKLFLKQNIKFEKVHFSENVQTNSVDYILDYEIICTGGNLDADWWSCVNGFYFQSKNLKFKYLGTDKRILKPIKKSI